MEDADPTPTPTPMPKVDDDRGMSGEREPELDIFCERRAGGGGGGVSADDGRMWGSGAAGRPTRRWTESSLA